ncbi:MAG: response regulator [Gammaproteobacteria bacterium]|nr:response regulator [Gammaproteobacteria bacterium]
MERPHLTVIAGDERRAFATLSAICAVAALFFAASLAAFGEPWGTGCFGVATLAFATAGIATWRTWLAVDAGLDAIACIIALAVTLHAHAMGGVVSATAWWLITIPSILLLFGRYRRAVAWLGLALVIEGALLGLELGGHDFPANALGGTRLLLAYGLGMFGLFGVLFTFLWMMDRSRRRLIAHLSDLNEALRAGNEALAAARDDALAAARARGNFLNNVSHELRTPLNGVVGAAELLALAADPEARTSQLDLLHRSAAELRDQVDRLVDLAQLGAGEISLAAVPFDPATLLEDIAARHAGSGPETRLRVLVDIRPQVPAQVRGDEARLADLLTQLVANAIKFTDRGTVLLRLAARVEAGTAHLRFEVRDTGVGIEGAALARIFEAFRAAEQGRLDRVHGGIGIGLALCRELATLMEGELDVESEAGHGSLFSLELSLPCLQAAAPPASGPLAGTTVALVAPDALVAEIVRDHVSTLGGRVESRGVAPGWSALNAPGAAGDGVLVVDSGSFDDATWFHLQDGGQPLRPLVVLCSGAREALRADRAGVPCVRPPLRREGFHVAVSAARRRAAAAASGALAPAGAAPLPPAIASARLLVVEDNLANQRLVLSFLEVLGYAADVAGNGAEAVERFRGASYALVIMDCQMPVLDGLAATRAMRAVEAADGRRRVPIVAVTANAMREQREACMAAGMDDYLSKPFRLDEFAELLRRHLPPH